MLIAGWQVIKTTPLDVFPEFSPILVEVQTEAQGLSTTKPDRIHQRNHADTFAKDSDDDETASWFTAGDPAAASHHGSERNCSNQGTYPLGNGCSGLDEIVRVHDCSHYRLPLHTTGA